MGRKNLYEGVVGRVGWNLDGGVWCGGLVGLITRFDVLRCKNNYKL